MIWQGVSVGERLLTRRRLLRRWVTVSGRACSQQPLTRRFAIALRPLRLQRGRKSRGRSYAPPSGPGCNFPKLNNPIQPAYDVNVTFAPKAPADLLSAQPALEALRLRIDDPLFSEAGLRDARCVVDEAVPVPESWASLPTSVDVDGQRGQLLMAIDNTNSKGRRKSAKATGAGYSRVTRLDASGVLVGDTARTAATAPYSKALRISGIGLAGKITEFKTAKQALIAAATHVAVQAAARQQVGV